METATTYLEQTESATRHLFDAVKSYIQILRGAPIPVYISGEPIEGEEKEARWRAWLESKADQIEAAKAAQARFSAEFFSMSVLCGSILQIAHMGLEMFSPVDAIPDALAHWRQDLGKNIKRYAKFCTGREVRGVPIGLMIYAGRNQHMHLDDSELREPSALILDRLTNFPGFPDPALDLSNGAPRSLAANITYLLEWRDYDAYLADMRALMALN